MEWDHEIQESLAWVRTNIQNIRRMQKWPEVPVTQENILVPTEFYESFMSVYFPVTQGREILKRGMVVTLGLPPQEILLPLRMHCEEGTPFKCCANLGDRIAGSCLQCAVNTLIYVATKGIWPQQILEFEDLNRFTLGYNMLNDFWSHHTLWCDRHGHG